jgi:hypothetical protein
MTDHSKPLPPPGGQFLVYQAEDGKLKIEVRFDGETVWLTQNQMAELFQTSVPNVSIHIRNLFKEKELREDSVLKEFLTTAADGKNYQTRFYNLDVIISVGYRVKSLRGTQFRIWATQSLREYIVKGFVLDDERLKNPDLPFEAAIRENRIVRLEGGREVSRNLTAVSPAPTEHPNISPGQRPGNLAQPNIKALKGRPNRCHNPSPGYTFTLS